MYYLYHLTTVERDREVPLANTNDDDDTRTWGEHQDTNSTTTARHWRTQGEQHGTTGQETKRRKKVKEGTVHWRTQGEEHETTRPKEEESERGNGKAKCKSQFPLTLISQLYLRLNFSECFMCPTSTIKYYFFATWTVVY